MGETADWLYNQRQNNLSIMSEVVEALEDNIFAKYDIDPDDVEHVYDAIASVGENYNNLDDAQSHLIDRLEEMSQDKEKSLKEDPETADLLRLKQSLKKVLFGSA
jgi:hypothetical protein